MAIFVHKGEKLGMATPSSLLIGPWQTEVSGRDYQVIVEVPLAKVAQDRLEDHLPASVSGSSCRFPIESCMCLHVANDAKRVC